MLRWLCGSGLLGRHVFSFIGGKLATGCRDFIALGIAHGARHSLCLDAAHEFIKPRLGGCIPFRARRRVERDHVDVHLGAELLVQLAAQHIGAEILVILIPNKGVLDRHAAGGFIGVVSCCVEDLIDGPAVIYRNQAIAQLIIRGVQRNRKCAGKVFVRELADGRCQAHGGIRSHCAVRAQSPFHPDR